MVAATEGLIQPSESLPRLTAWSSRNPSAANEKDTPFSRVAVSASVSEYLQGEDTLGGWLEERCNIRQDARTLSGAAYRSFKSWADAAGEYVPSQKRFTQRLRDRNTSKT